MKGRIKFANLGRSVVGDGWLITDEVSRRLETTDDAREVVLLIPTSLVVSSMGDCRLSSALDAMEFSSSDSCALSLPLDFGVVVSGLGSGSWEPFPLIERVTRGGPEGGERRLRLRGRGWLGTLLAVSRELVDCSESEACFSISSAGEVVTTEGFSLSSLWNIRMRAKAST